MGCIEENGIDMVMMRNLIKKYIIFIIMIFVLPGIGLAAPDQGGKQPVKPGPKEAAKRPSAERFYQCLERLLNGYGHDPAKWPDQVDKITVNLYLKEVLGLTPDQVVFRRNMLGYGVGETKAQARADFEKGRVDAWGVPYDLILASSGSDARVRSIMAGVAITQGFEAYNEELTEKTYILLKADLHSQFGEVFRNFNGRTINIRAREINFMGCPDPAWTNIATRSNRPWPRPIACGRPFISAIRIRCPIFPDRSAIW